MQGNGAKQPKPLQMKNHLPMVFTQGINFWNQNIEVQWYFKKKIQESFPAGQNHITPDTLLFVIPFVILLPYINCSALRSITLNCEELVVPA